MSISQNFPDLTPTLNLNFAGSKKLDSRVTFTRGSTGTYMDDNGIIKTAGINVPRFDHSFNGTSVESLGLLVEESRSNISTYSEDISQYQFIENASVTTNSIVAPDGTTTADTLTSTVNGGTNTCMVQKYTAVPIDTSTYTFSVFLKAGTSPTTTINLQLAGGTYQQSVATINWTSNTITFSTGGTSSLVSYPNGWYRLSITLTNNGTNNAIYPRIYVRDQGSSNVSGHNVYIWGWQTELGSFPTSYIPTGASQVTRSADAASITGTNFSNWYNPNEWTLFVNQSLSSSVLLSSPAEVQNVSIGDGTTNNYYTIRYVTDTTSPYIDGYANTSGVPVIDTAGSSGSTFPNPVKSIFAVKLNDSAFCYNGNVVQVDTSCTLSTSVNRMTIGGSPKTGTISQVSYYPKRLTNTQLQNLTK